MTTKSPWVAPNAAGESRRSEEHTSELQSLRHLVCRLLLEKKKKKIMKKVNKKIMSKKNYKHTRSNKKVTIQHHRRISAQYNSSATRGTTDDNAYHSQQDRQ